MVDYNIYLQYPTLVKDLLLFFSIDNISSKRTVLDFCNTYGMKNALNPGNTAMIQPNTVNTVCKALCELKRMSVMESQSIDGLNNRYFVVLKDSKVLEEKWEEAAVLYNTPIYGFKYLYHYMKDNVLPIIYYRENGDVAIGTCFHFFNGIVTCKHCIEGAKNIAIKGYSASFLNKQKIFISSDKNIDLAFIPNVNNFTYPYAEDGEIMDEVVTMGYPKIPCYSDFLNIEKAHVSSDGRKVISTQGAISSIGENYLSKMETLLITARVRGGNSGGPIFNRRGYLVGIACETLGAEGDYDDMGYGVAVKSSELKKILNSENIETLETPKDYFVDFQ